MLKKNIDYYSSLLDKHGASPEGVGWNGQAAQEIRFSQLCHLVRLDSFSVNDLGCGTGDLANYLRANYKSVDYTGYDVIPKMIATAKARFKESNTRFKLICSGDAMQEADYTLASGIFNLKFNQTETEWREFILSSLRTMDRSSRYGFAFNALTQYSDQLMMKRDLFYADPLWLFDFCKKNFSRNVALLHDYNIYDFTILVRK